MSQEHFDHAYACGVSNHIGPAVQTTTTETDIVTDSAVVIQAENTEHETFTEAEVPDFQAVSKKVLVESVNATDLGAIHEKLIKSSPNKNWYLSEKKNVDKTRNGSLSSSSTETCDSEVEQMDVDKDVEKENGENEKDEVDGVNREQNNGSVSPTESAEYTPMSPVPMEEEPAETGEQIGGNLLKEIENEQEQDDSHSDKDKSGDDNNEKSEESHSQQDPPVNGFADHEYAKGGSDHIDNENDKDDEDTDVDEPGLDQENDLNETDQNVTQSSELNGSLDVSSDGAQTDSVDPGSEKRLVAPLVIKRKGRPRGRGRGRGKHRRWSQGWTRISPRKRSGDFSGYLGDTGEQVFV